MNSTSLELCEELYKLSGWEPSHNRSDVYSWWRNPYKITEKLGIPKYSLGYLLRKLPEEFPDDYALQIRREPTDCWYAGYYDKQGNSDLRTESSADSPEDAACKLAIKLFRQGVFE